MRTDYAPHIPQPSDICSVCGDGLVHIDSALDAARANTGSEREADPATETGWDDTMSAIRGGPDTAPSPVHSRCGVMAECPCWSAGAHAERFASDRLCPTCGSALVPGTGTSKGSLVCASGHYSEHGYTGSGREAGLRAVLVRMTEADQRDPIGNWIFAINAALTEPKP